MLHKLRERGLASLDGDRYHLTSQGAAGFDRLLDKVSASRRAMADGIEPDEYRATLAVLERMARNLGWGDGPAAAAKWSHGCLQEV